MCYSLNYSPRSMLRSQRFLKLKELIKVTKVTMKENFENVLSVLCGL